MLIKRFFFLLIFLVSPAIWATVDIEHWQTSQGARVYYYRAAGLPMVDIQISFDAGSARDEHQWGVSALTSTLLDEGAGAWNADQIAERFASVGAQFGSGVSRDMAWLSLRTLTDKPLYDKAIETLQTVMSAPAFTEADFQRKQAQTLAAIKHQLESPATVASDAYYKTLYHDHPYAHPSYGSVETVSAITAQDLRTFYQRYYVSSNAIVVIVGDVDTSQVEQLAETLLAKLPAGSKPQPIAPVPPLQEGTNQHIDFPSTQTHVLSGLLGKHRKDPDYIALYVGNYILGGSGLVSQLFSEVREKRGLAYSAYSYFSPMYREGPFTMGLQTRNDQTDQAVDVMQKTLKQFIENGPTEAEMKAAKKNITGGFALRIDTNRKLTDYINMIGFYQLPLDYLDSFPQRVEAVTREQVKDAFQRRVKPTLLQTITVGGGQ